MDISTLTKYALASISIIFAAYFLFNKLKLLHKRIIASFLFIEVFHLTFPNMIDSGILLFGDQTENIRYSAESLIFLLPPILYMLTKSILNPRYKIVIKHLLHAIPFVLLTGFPFIYQIIIDRQENEIIYIQDIYSILFLIQFSIYIITSLSYIKYYGKMRHTHRRIKHDDRVKMLQLILFSFFVTWIFNTAFNTFLTISSGAVDYLNFLHITINSISLGIMIFLGIHFGNIFNISPSSKKFQYTYLSDEDKRRYLEDLHLFIMVKKPYREEKITLETASKYLNIRAQFLTKILQEKLNKNFDEYLDSLNNIGSIKSFSD